LDEKFSNVTTDVLDLISAQTWPEPANALRLETLADGLNTKRLLSRDVNAIWCAGLVCALAGRKSEARRYLQRAEADLVQLDKQWSKQKEASSGNWAKDGVQELQLLQQLLDDQPKFERHCMASATRNAKALGLVE
jgi:hypothetical protein